MMPSAFDEAGIWMLDSVCEILDSANFKFESVHFDVIQYNNFEELKKSIIHKTYPVVDVLGEYIDPAAENGSRVMVATGIKNENGIDYIQLKNSSADNPIEQGEVQKIILNLTDFVQFLEYI